MVTWKSLLRTLPLLYTVHDGNVVGQQPQPGAVQNLPAGYGVVQPILMDRFNGPAPMPLPIRMRKGGSRDHLRRLKRQQADDEDGDDDEDDQCDADDEEEDDTSCQCPNPTTVTVTVTEKAKKTAAAAAGGACAAVTTSMPQQQQQQQITSQGKATATNYNNYATTTSGKKTANADAGYYTTTTAPQVQAQYTTATKAKQSTTANSGGSGSSTSQGTASGATNVNISPNPFGMSFQKSISAFSAGFLGEQDVNWCGYKFGNTAGIVSLSLEIWSQAYGSSAVTYFSNPTLWQKMRSDICGLEIIVTGKDGKEHPGVIGDCNISDSCDLNLNMWNAVAGTNAQSMSQIPNGMINSYNIGLRFTGRKFQLADYTYPYTY